MQFFFCAFYIRAPETYPLSHKSANMSWDDPTGAGMIGAVPGNAPVTNWDDDDDEVRKRLCGLGANAVEALELIIVVPLFACSLTHVLLPPPPTCLHPAALSLPRLGRILGTLRTTKGRWSRAHGTIPLRTRRFGFVGARLLRFVWCLALLARFHLFKCL